MWNGGVYGRELVHNDSLLKVVTGLHAMPLALCCGPKREPVNERKVIFKQETSYAAQLLCDSDYLMAWNDLSGKFIVAFNMESQDQYCQKFVVTCAG